MQRLHDLVKVGLKLNIKFVQIFCCKYIISSFCKNTHNYNVFKYNKNFL